MATNVSLNGNVYSIPSVGDDSWGPGLTDYFIAIPNAVLQRNGGNFVITADVNFGATYGLLAKYFSGRSNAATDGLIRLGNLETIEWRNLAGSGNLVLSVNASDQLTYQGVALTQNGITALTGDVTATGPGSVAATIAAGAVDNAKIAALAAIDFSKLAALPAGQVLVGNLSNVAAAVAVSGDIALSAAGVATIAPGAVDNSKVSASAGIDFSKLAALTSGNILVGSVGNVATSVAMSGDVTIVAGGATTIANNAVSNAKLAQVATATIKGRVTSGTGDVEDLTGAQATTLLSNVVGDSGSGGVKGLVPAPAAGDAAAGKFLKADGTFAVPPGSGSSGPILSVATASGQALPSGGDVLIYYDEIIVDSASCFDTITSRYTPNVSGWYTITGCVTLSGTFAATSGSVNIYKNGSMVRSAGSGTDAGGSLAYNPQYFFTFMIDMNGTTDYLEVYFNTSGGTYALTNATPARTVLNMVRVLDL